MKTLAIVNPAARKGNAASRWATVQEKLAASDIAYDVRFTEAPGHATQLAASTLDDGYERIITVGGDGTLNEVINGVVKDGVPLNPDLVLAPIPAGTANEICRACGFLDDPDAPYRAIKGGKTRAIDLQLVDCIGFDGQPRRLHSVLATSFGSAALISYKTSQSRFIKKLGAELSYYIVALIVTLSYEPTELSLAVDDRSEEKRLIHSGLICNGAFVGGGIPMAPMAKLDDGICEMVEFGNFGRFDLITRPRSWLMQSHHLEHPEVTVLPGQKYHVHGRDDVWVDSDGETVGKLPLTVEVHKQAIKIPML